MSIKDADDAVAPFRRMRSFWSSPSSNCLRHAVNGLALLVHHVVVFEDVFAGGEVLRLDRLLRLANALA